MGEIIKVAGRQLFIADWVVVFPNLDVHKETALEGKQVSRVAPVFPGLS
jgi:hypothetical protein